MHGLLQKMAEQPIDPVPKDQVTSAKITAIAKRYFSSWKTKYKQQVNPAEEAKRIQKDKNARTRDRRHAKCDRRLAQAPEFDQTHGTKGSARYIRPAFQSPEHSDSGEAERTDWEAERVRKNGGSSGWETRKILYRATWVSSRSSLNVKSRLTSETKLSRLFYALDQLADKKSAPGKGQVSHERWHGLEVNSVSTAPPFGKGEVSFECMYDPDWLAQNEQKKGLVLPTPADFELDKYAIEDECISEADRQAL